MGGVRVVMFVLGAGILSGCAGGRVHQDLARLQSQVGLLDDRVTQLERSGMSDVSASSFPESSIPSLPAPIATVSTKKSTKVSKASSVPSVKPTTREIQQALKNAGFYQGTIDGKMGAQTREAIKEFQRVHGLHDDGVAGKQTWAKLQAYADLSVGETSTTATALK